MLLRICNICGRNLAVDKMRFLKLKKSSVLFYSQKDSQYLLESKCNEEIAICEGCGRQHSLYAIFEIIEKKAAGRLYTEEKKDD